ncbi:acyl-CoA N-acyltransferase [Hesseltinella vesiculosa]|uniref:Acyl-CoA N-acyltransferase n=1 Tax=Hesseltinella vesiculosa TaxID=101127 RepID=A0A1X2GCE8_9FUNG|nr:acyl-CoA N-acyltransferase [Hesseltinella vesiculosa]
MTLTFSKATLADLPTLANLEAQSYHPDEAASEENLRKRIMYASAIPEPELMFLVARQGSSIVGFVCTSLSHESLLPESSMASNEPSGSTVCIHSVCVSPAHRRQGIARDLLTHWIALHRQLRRFDRLVMLSRPSLVDFYSSVGFVRVGVSSVTHGPVEWIDCVLDLQSS